MHFPLIFFLSLIGFKIDLILLFFDTFRVNFRTYRQVLIFDVLIEALFFDCLLLYRDLFLFAFHFLFF